MAAASAPWAMMASTRPASRRRLATVVAVHHTLHTGGPDAVEQSVLGHAGNSQLSGLTASAAAHAASSKDARPFVATSSAFDGGARPVSLW